MCRSISDFNSFTFIAASGPALLALSPPRPLLPFPICETVECPKCESRLYYLHNHVTEPCSPMGSCVSNFESLPLPPRSAHEKEGLATSDTPLPRYAHANVVCTNVVVNTASECIGRLPQQAGWPPLRPDTPPLQSTVSRLGGSGLDSVLAQSEVGLLLVCGDGQLVGLRGGGTRCGCGWQVRGAVTLPGAAPGSEVAM